jgi:succinyldiaminopimelate transaminase
VKGKEPVGDAGEGAPLPTSAYLRELTPYPFAHLDALRERVEARGMEVIDLGLGDPAEETPAFIRESIVASIPVRSTYPRAAGLASLRSAVAGWLLRRFGVEVDPDREVLPANGSKEAIFSLPLAVLDRATRPVVLVPDPGYPVYALGAQAAGGETVALPLREENGFLPDLGAIPESVWKRASILWINYPNNPTGGVAPASFLEEAARRCREHGTLLASDEAYSEITFEEPPRSALEFGNENVLVLNTLSKRSGMPGFRSGFMAGDPRLIEGLKRMRPALGVATPSFIQEAARAAWDDDAHVAPIRERFRERRDLAVTALRARGFPVKAPPATFYLWLRVPGGESSASFATRCLERGVVVLPGEALGPSGEGYVRVSLTAPRDTLVEALARFPDPAV